MKSKRGESRKTGEGASNEKPKKGALGKTEGILHLERQERGHPENQKGFCTGKAKKGTFGKPEGVLHLKSKKGK